MDIVRSFLTSTRSLIERFEFSSKDETLKIIDGLILITNYLSKLELDEIIVEAFNIAKDEKKIDSANVNTFETIKSEEGKSFVSTFKKFILPYLTQLFKFIFKIKNPKTIENNQISTSTINNKTINQVLIVLEAVSYIINFGLLVHCFYTIQSAKKSNLTAEKKKELETRIEKIENLIKDADIEFNSNNWKKYEFLNGDIKDNIEELIDEIKKLKCEIDGKMFSLILAESRAEYVTISSVLDTATNIVDVIRNPESIVLKAFLGLSIAFTLGGSLAIILSKENIKNLQTSLDELNKLKLYVKELRDKHKKKYNEYLEK